MSLTLPVERGAASGGWAGYSLGPGAGVEPAVVTTLEVIGASGAGALSLLVAGAMAEVVPAGPTIVIPPRTLSGFWPGLSATLGGAEARWTGGRAVTRVGGVAAY